MKAIITIGPSASGKSSWAENFKKLEKDYWCIINRDDIRFDRFCNGERNWQKYKWKHEKEVTKIQNELIKFEAENSNNIIISDTNLNPRYRNILVKNLKQLGYEIIIKEFNEDLETLFKRDKLRENGTGLEVIYKQYLQWLEYKGFEKYIPDTSKPKCVIVDVDGTVAKMNSRGPFDWNRVREDLPITQVLDIVEGLYYLGYNIVFLSGRDSVCYDLTHEWLEKYFGLSFELFMRPEGDFRKDYVIKKELFDNHVRENYCVEMVIDDRVSILENLWIPLGIKVINVGNLHERF